MAYPDKCMNKDGRRHDSTSTTIRKVGLISNNFSALASLCESYDGRALRRKKGSFLIRLNLDEDCYINHNQSNPAHREIKMKNIYSKKNSHWISLCRL
jgi:hypothetical protein